MDLQDTVSIQKDWDDLQNEYQVLEALNKDYLERLQQLVTLQEQCSKQLNHQNYRISLLGRAITRLKSSKSSPQDGEQLTELTKQVEKRKLLLHEIEQSLPKTNNGLYLHIILGSVNVSIPNKNDKFKYKDEYEKFKLVLSVIALALSVLNLVVLWRPLELAFMFLLVWYYCTLTIRESILKVNGSRIKGWWRLHHFISTFAAGVLLIWPPNEPWYIFRKQFIWFNCYISFVQYLQFRYQQGVLYRLKALGERHNMDITIEGFHSWMWRGLSFLLPALFVGYIFQLYNAYTLYTLTSHSQATWQIPVLCATFFSLFLGNTVTTCMVVPQKFGKKFNGTTDTPSHSSGNTKKQHWIIWAGSKLHVLPAKILWSWTHVIIIFYC